MGNSKNLIRRFDSLTSDINKTGEKKPSSYLLEKIAKIVDDYRMLKGK